MNALTQPLQRPRGRIAELDPFGVGADFEAQPSYGCVDWFVYEEPSADTPAPQPQAPIAKTALPRVAIESQTRTQRY